ncbi:MAG TPA: S9 family peptidase [Nitrospirales bacterium]|nr:S9 family peptidase [Nitrospirales bacterium]
MTTRSSHSNPLLPTPPRAKRVPHRLERHGHVRTDEYYWLRDRENPEVLAYLQAENEYAATLGSHTRELEQTIFEEIKGRIQPTDLSVPFRMGDFWYYIRYEKGKEYALYCRKEKSLTSPETIMIDGNELAQGHDYFSVGNWTVSSGQNILAFAIDTRGRRMYTIGFKNLDTGETFDECIPLVTGNMEWGNDNRTLFYSRQDPETLRSFQIFRHRLGTDPKLDTLVYEETDETFSVSIEKTKSKRYLLIGSHQSITSEYRYVNADHPEHDFQIFQARKRGHEYDVDHLGDYFFIRTNDEAKNFRLMRTEIKKTDITQWQEVIPHRVEVFLEGFELFENFLVLEERKQGLIHLRMLRTTDGSEHELDFGEPAYLATLGDNLEADTPYLRFGYTSMTTPMTIYDYHMESREKILLKQEPVLGDFHVSHYQTERLFAPAPDGVSIPISLVYKKGFAPNGTHPLLLYGYGSYGASIDASFSSPRLSLLDRGFVYAIAHIRGGEELGRQWYESGKLLYKKNTFTDFIACAEFLVKKGYGAPQKLFALGGSAGGLLMGAIMNMRPDLFHGVVAQVPFVDVVTTMLDPNIPLTTGEYDEWGDPNQQQFYEYMLSYSPYDNLLPQSYPHLLVTSGLHDSQVQFWEPTKWVAKLRALRTDNQRLLLKTNMDAGHSGASGRFKRYEETAMIYAFLLDLADSVDL